MLREQKKKLSALEMELVAARQEGFVSSHLPEKNSISNKRPLVVIGILTGFSHKSKRDAVRKAWMGTGIYYRSVFVFLCSFGSLLCLDAIFREHISQSPFCVTYIRLLYPFGFCG